MSINQQQPVDTAVLNELSSSIRTGWADLAEAHRPSNGTCMSCGIPSQECRVRRQALDHLAAA